MRPLIKYSDKELIPLLKKGEIKAFDELYFRHVPQLLKFSRTFISDSTEAEEAVQEIFIKIWERRMNLDEDQNFKSYVFQSVKNFLLNRIRDRKKLYQIEEINPGYELAETHPLDGLCYRELEETVFELVEKLPEVQKQVFTLSRMDGLNHKEIAEKLNLSIRTVEHHVYLASKNLKGHMVKLKKVYLAITFLIFLIN